MKYLYTLFLILSLNGCNELIDQVTNNEVTFVSHNQGKSCLQCHSFNGGTIYKYIDSTIASSSTVESNYTIKLQFVDNTTLTMLIGNGSGNFRTNSSITKDFTAQIINSNGDIIKTSPTHSSSNTDCNSCHTSSGLNGAKGRIYTTNTLSTTTPTIIPTIVPTAISFTSHNQGENCKKCHSNFSMAGTIYTSIDATSANSSSVATDYKARLTFADGSILLANIARGNGNIYSKTTINQTFSVEILDPNSKIVNSSSTHQIGSTSCNSCHTSNGVNGANGRVYTTEALTVSSSSGTVISNGDDDDEDEDEDDD